MRINKGKAANRTVKVEKSSALLEEATRQLNEGKYSRAFTLLKDLLAADPTHREGRRLLATLLLKFGNLVTAKHAFDSLLQEAMQRGEYQEAESLLKEYLSIGTRCVPFIEMLGQVYERKGDSIAAVIEYEKAIKILLEDPENSSHARELYQKVTLLAPQSFVLDRLKPKFEVPASVEPRTVVPPYAPIEAIPAVSNSLVHEETAPMTQLSEAESIGTVQETRVPSSSFRLVEETDPEPKPDDTTDDAAPETINAGRPVDESQGVEPPVQAAPIPQEEVLPAAAEDSSETDSGHRTVVHPEEQGEETGSAHVSPENHADAEKVPFPPVNHMPPASRNDEPMKSPSAETDTGIEEAPFWERVEEPVPVASQTEPSSRIELEMDGPPQSAEPDAPGAGHHPQPETFLASEEVRDSSERFDAPPEQHDVPPASEPASNSVPASMEVMRLAGGYAIAEEQSDEAIMRSRKRRPASKSVGVATLLRIWTAVFIRRCVATAGSMTRLLMFLMLSMMAVMGLGLGAIAALWLSLEQKQTHAFQDLIKVSPPRTLEDPEKNGYFLLFGFNAGESSNPLRSGYEDWLGAPKEADHGCTASGEEVEPQYAGRFRAADPAQQFKDDANPVKEWTGAHTVFLNRYRQWLSMPFDDWGFGRLGSPDCAQIASTHRLYVAEGFAQDLQKGIDRLETDLTAWRNVLRQAKTLSLKLLAVQAVDDDVHVVIGLLARQNLDSKYVQRLSRLARPLDPDERALRWPMQDEFLREVKKMDDRLRPHPETDPPLTVVLLKLPLPKQRNLNAYAAYYDALIKTPKTKDSVLPKPYDFARTPARTWIDYVANPLDNLVREHPVPDWVRVTNLVMELDARLRLAALQARLRGPLSESALSSRIAQAGPSFYDPFTELPMLLNAAQGRIYSTGADGKDDGGDPTFDLSVPLAAKGPSAN